LRAAPGGETPPARPATPDAEVVVDVHVGAAVAPAQGPSVLPGAEVGAGPDRSPQEQFIRAVVSGATLFSEAIDPEYGVVSVLFLSPRTDIARRPVGRALISNHRRCGADLRRAIPAFQRDLADIVQAVDAGQTFRCEDDRCVVQGGGTAPAWHLRFSARHLPSPRLELVARVSESGMDQAWISRVQAYVDRARAVGGSRPCTMACLSRARDVPSGIDSVVDLLGGLDAAVRAHGYLGLAELATGFRGDIVQTMRTYIRRSPSSPLAAAWLTYLQGR
jgi:hypothetical protein